MLQAVLFDMDGVLYDSMKNHAEAWYQTMHVKYGFECSRTLFYEYEGATGAQAIDALFTEQRGRHATTEEIETMYGHKRVLFESMGKPSPMPGASRVLQWVQQQHLTRVLVTGSGQPTLLDNLALDYPDAFDAHHMVSAKDTPVGRGKPHPDPYLMGLQKAGNLRPDQAVVIENAPLGVQAARAAGIFTIAVNTGPLDPSLLYGAGANIVLESMDALADVFPQLLQQNGFL